MGIDTYNMCARGTHTNTNIYVHPSKYIFIGFAECVLNPANLPLLSYIYVVYCMYYVMCGIICVSLLRVRFFPVRFSVFIELSASTGIQYILRIVYVYNLACGYNFQMIRNPFRLDISSFEI